MTPEEKFDAAVDSALRDRRELIRFLEGFSDAQAAWRPPNGEWSIAEGVEHILITDSWVRETLVEFLEKSEAAGNWDTAPKNPKKLSNDQLRRREQGRVDAPDHLLPKGDRPLSEMDSLILRILATPYAQLCEADRQRLIMLLSRQHREREAIRFPKFGASGNIEDLR